MKLKIQQSELNAALSITGKAINTNAIVPMFGNYLITADSIAACNGELSISRSITAKGKMNIAVNATRLAGLIRDLPEQELTLDAADGLLTITAFSGSYAIPYEPGDDFPVMAIEGEPVALRMDADTLTGLIDKTSFAMAANELRPAMCGTSLQVVKGVAEFATTNGTVMSVFRTETDAPDISIIIPPKAIKALSDVTGDVAIEVYGNNVLFSYADVVIKLRLIDGRYPDYRAVTPKEQPYSMAVDRLQLISSIRRVAGFSDKMHNVVAFDITADTLTVTGENIDYKERGTETIKCDSTGTERIGVNAILMLKSLAVLDMPEVAISFDGPKRPMVIQAQNGYILIMPFVVI